MSEETGTQEAGEQAEVETETPSLPIEFSEDGKEATVHLSDDETVTVPTDKLVERFNKAAGFDKQAGELGTLRKEREADDKMFGDLRERISKSDDPNAEIAKLKAALEAAPETDDTFNIFDEDKPKKELPPEKQPLTRGQYDEMRAGERAQEHMDAEMKRGMSEHNIPDAMRPLVEQAVYMQALDSDETPDLPDLVGKEWTRLSEAVHAQDKADKEALDAKKIADGGDISNMGQAASGIDDPRRDAELGSKEHNEYLAEKIHAKYFKKA